MYYSTPYARSDLHVYTLVSPAALSSFSLNFSLSPVRLGCSQSTQKSRTHTLRSSALTAAATACTSTPGLRTLGLRTLYYYCACSELTILRILSNIARFQSREEQVEEVIKDRTPCIFGRLYSETNLLTTDSMASI